MLHEPTIIKQKRLDKPTYIREAFKVDYTVRVHQETFKFYERPCRVIKPNLFTSKCYLFLNIHNPAMGGYSVTIVFFINN